MNECEDCKVYIDEIVELKEKIESLEERIEELERAIDDEVSVIRTSCDSLIKLL